MSKIEELKNLKILFDNGVINELEFNLMKSKILNDEYEIRNTEKGSLTISFVGQWFLYSPKTKIYINDVLDSEHSTKHGFSRKIKLESPHLKIKVSLGFRSTEYILRELELNSNYSLDLIYDTAWGKFSKKFELSKDFI